MVITIFYESIVVSVFYELVNIYVSVLVYWMRIPTDPELLISFSLFLFVWSLLTIF